MGKSSIATLVSVQLSNDIASMALNRAKKRGVSRSRFVAILLEKWRDEGYPAVDAIDETAKALVQQEINDAKSKAGNKTAQQKGFSAFQRVIHKDGLASEASVSAKMPAYKPKKKAS